MWQTIEVVLIDEGCFLSGLWLLYAMLFTYIYRSLLMGMYQ